MAKGCATPAKGAPTKGLAKAPHGGKGGFLGGSPLQMIPKKGKK